MKSFYRELLAHIHNNFFGNLARNAAMELLLHTQHTNLRSVIDLGCGSGIFASILSKQNFHVTGVDISQDMINLAKSAAPKASFFCSSLFTFDIHPTDIITAIGEPLNYLFDNRTTYQELAILFQKIYTNLHTSGIFMFDILTDTVDTNPSMRIVDEEEITMYIETMVDAEHRILTRKMIYFTKLEACYQKDTETHKQFLFNVETIENLLTKTGFRYVKQYRYADFLFRQGHVAFMCTK